MGEQVINPSTGEIFELRGGEWQSVNRQELAGKMAAEDFGADKWYGKGGGAFLLGAGRELSSMGAGIRNLYAQATGDDAGQQKIAQDESEASRYMAGAGDAMPTSRRLLMAAGGAAPYLATAPLGLGVGGAATRGLAAAAESTAIGSALGGVKYSGDQATDAITGGLLSLGGYGLGSLASRVVQVIKAGGAEGRAALVANAGITGKILEAAQKAEVPGGLKVLGEMAHAGLEGSPVRALTIGAKYAGTRALQNPAVADALLALSGVRGGGAAAAYGGALGGRIGPAAL